MKSAPELTFHSCELPSLSLICSTLQIQCNVATALPLLLQNAGVSEIFGEVCAPSNPSHFEISMILSSLQNNNLKKKQVVKLVTSLVEMSNHIMFFWSLIPKGVLEQVSCAVS